MHQLFQFDKIAYNCYLFCALQTYGKPYYDVKYSVTCTNFTHQRRSTTAIQFDETLNITNNQNNDPVTITLDDGRKLTVTEDTSGGQTTYKFVVTDSNGFYPKTITYTPRDNITVEESYGDKNMGYDAHIFKVTKYDITQCVKTSNSNIHTYMYDDRSAFDWTTESETISYAHNHNIAFEETEVSDFLKLYNQATN